MKPPTQCERLGELHTTLHTVLPVTLTTASSKDLSLHDELATRD